MTSPRVHLLYVGNVLSFISPMSSVQLQRNLDEIEVQLAQLEQKHGPIISIWPHTKLDGYLYVATRPR